MTDERSGMLTQLRKSIKGHRQNAGLTLHEVSEQTGLSTAYLSDIERGRSKATFNTLDRLLDFYGIDYSNPYTEAEQHLIQLWRDDNYAAILGLIAERLQS